MFIERTETEHSLYQQGKPFTHWPQRRRPPFDVSEDQLVFPSIMEKIVGATIVHDLNTIPDHVKDNNEFSRGQNKEYLAPLIS